MGKSLHQKYGKIVSWGEIKFHLKTNKNLKTERGLKYKERGF